MGLVILASLLCLSARSNADPTADALLREIDSRGAKRVLGHLTSNWARFEGVCERIETGDASWLEVARRLKPASDAASSLSLSFPSRERYRES